jgi:hypothetical protein
MKGILLLLSIPAIIGLLAFAGIVANDPPDMPQVDRQTGDNLICWGTFGLVAIVGMIVFPSLYGDATGIAAELNQVYQINDPRHKVPERDANGSFIGYRYFIKSPDGTLEAMSKGRIGHNPITGRKRGSYAGGWNIADRVPTLKNTSGIYAAKTWDSPILDDYKEGAVLAKVELSGKVIEADRGYRAQYCRIIETYGE